MYVSEATPSPLEVVKTGEVGTGGTLNFNGQIVSGEPNQSELSHTRAYGTGPKWGEWETVVRTDPDVNSALNHVVAPIRDAILDVRPAKHPLIDEKLAQAQADFVKFNIVDFLETRWCDFSAQAVKGSLGCGFALHEKVLARCTHPLLPGGQGYAIRKLAERLPSTIQSNGWKESANADGEVDLISIVQQGLRYVGTSAQWRSEIVLPAEKVLLTTWDRSANNYAGYSIFRPSYYLIKIRRALARIMAIGYEREALGVPTASNTSGDLSTDLDGKQMKVMQEALQGLTYHEAASVVMPRGWKLDFLCSPQADKSHVIEAYNTLGTIILRQVSAQLLSIGTTDNTGNRSLGEMHGSISAAFIDSLISMLEGVVNGSRAYNGLGRSIIVPNWGEMPAYPTIHWTPKKADLDIPKRIDAISKASAAGILRITDADESTMREMVGLPTEILSPRPENVVDAGKPIQDTALNGAQVTSAVVIVTSANRGEISRDAAVAMLAEFFQIETETASKLVGEKPEGSPAPSPSNLPPVAPTPTAKPEVMMRRFAAGAEFVPSRPLRDSEKALNLRELSAYIGFAGQPGTAVKSFESRVRPVVAEMLVKALPEIKAAMADGDPSEVADIALDTSRLTPLVDKYLAEVEAEGYRQARNEKAKGEGAQILKDRADGAPGVKPIALAADGSGTLRKAQVGLSVRRLTARIKEAIDQEAVEVIRTGGEPTEVIGNVLDRQLDSAAFRGEAGSITTRAFNIGREQFAEQYGDQIESVEYSAILDNETCEVCADLDGETFDFQSDAHIANTPPNRNCEGGSRCRCVLVYQWKKPEDA